MCSWIVEGVCSTSGNIMTFWKTNFNMPVPCLFNGSSDYDAGFMAARYCDIGWSSRALTGFCAGYEIALADGLARWCVDSDSLNGIGCMTLRWYRGATCLFGYGGLICIDLSAPPGYWQSSWYESMTNIGVAGWEVCCNGTYCTIAQVANYSGGDVSIGACTICLDFGSVPDVSQCSSSLRGTIWVEGEDLHYINANCWEHTIVGSGYASTANVGAIFIDNSHYLNWVGESGTVYQAPWRICQFCSTFSNGAPANPAPGASYAGAIWVDNQFGWTHLSYIGCDGNKYLAGGGNYPYQAPY